MKKILYHITASTLILLLIALSSGFVLNSLTCSSSGKTIVQVGADDPCCTKKQADTTPTISQKCCEKRLQNLDLTDFVNNTHTYNLDQKIVPSQTNISILVACVSLTNNLLTSGNSPPDIFCQQLNKHSLQNWFCTYII